MHRKLIIFSTAMKRILKTSLLCLITFMFSISSYSQKKSENQLKSAVKNEKNSTKRFLKIIELGEYYQENNLILADSINDVLLNKSYQLDKEQQFKALLFSAEIAKLQGNQDEYFRDILALKPLIPKLKSQETKFDVYLHLGYYYSSSLNFVESRKYLDLAMKLSKKTRNNKNISETYSSIAFNFMLANQKDSSIIYTDLSLQYARRSANKSVLAESFNMQAQVYGYFGQTELSVAKNLVSNQLAIDGNDFAKMDEAVSHVIKFFSKVQFRQ